MAQAPNSRMKQTLAEMDKPTKLKLIGAMTVLLLALVWLVIWSGLLSGDPNKAPTLSADELAKIQAENDVERLKIEEQNKKSVVRPGRPLPKPQGS